MIRMFMRDRGDRVRVNDDGGTEGEILAAGIGRASGMAYTPGDFINPAGVRFAFGKLPVADINGDYIAGRREVPEGLIVALESTP